MSQPESLAGLSPSPQECSTGLSCSPTLPAPAGVGTGSRVTGPFPARTLQYTQAHTHLLIPYPLHILSPTQCHTQSTAPPLPYTHPHPLLHTHVCTPSTPSAHLHPTRTLIPTPHLLHTDAHTKPPYSHPYSPHLQTPHLPHTHTLTPYIPHTLTSTPQNLPAYFTHNPCTPTPHTHIQLPCLHTLFHTHTPLLHM